MHARVSTFQGPPEAADQAVRDVREKVLPAVRAIPGSKGVIALVDRVTGKSIGITLWETEQSMKESEEAASHIRNQSVSDPGAEVVGVERFEVAVFEVG